jgi:hypothetical protein
MDDLEQSGVECTVCGARNPQKRHFARGKYTTVCPVCRRKATNKKSQLAYAARQRASEDTAARLLIRVKRAALARVGRLIFSVEVQVRNISAATRPDSRRAPALARHGRNLRMLHRVRAAVAADMERGVFLPLAHYLTDPGE